MENISNNLYYHENYNSIQTKDNKFLAIPVRVVDVLLELKSKELNIFEEIMLKMCQCGQYEVEEIKEVLNLDESLIDYIKIELNNKGYTEDEIITNKGEEVLENKINDIDRKKAKVYFNHLTGKYFDYIDFEPLDKFQKNNVIEKIKITKGNIDIGTTGKPKKINVVKFIENEKKGKLEINTFFRIRDKAVYSLKSMKMNEWQRENIQNLKDIVKYEVIGINESNFLLSYIDDKGNIYSPFNRNKKNYDEEFREKIYKNNEIKRFLKVENELQYNPSLGEKEENTQNINNEIKKIIELSDNKLKGKDELLNLLKEFYFLAEIKDEKTYISNIYKTFVAALWEYSKKFDVPLEKYNYTGFKNKLERLLNINFKLKLDGDLFRYYSSVNKGEMKYSRSAEVLKGSLITVLLLEQETSSKKLCNFIKKNSYFLQDIEKLIKFRNNIDHNGEEADGLSQGDLIDYGELVIKFIEEIFDFSFFKDENKQTRISYEDNLKVKAQKKLKLNCEKLFESRFRKELIEVQFRYEMFKELKHENSKNMIIKKIGVLFEKNLKELSEYVIKKNIKLLPKDNRIIIKDVASYFFGNSIENKGMDKINDEFNLDSLQEISFKSKKVENTFYTYKHGKGTLNTYTAVLLYSTMNNDNFLNKLLKELPEFFKACFVISRHRGHSGKIDMDVDELGNLIDSIYKIQEKYIELKGE